MGYNLANRCCIQPAGLALYWKKPTHCELAFFTLLVEKISIQKAAVFAAFFVSQHLFPFVFLEIEYNIHNHEHCRKFEHESMYPNENHTRIVQNS